MDGEASLAKKLYPNWDYPQQSLDPLSVWPDDVYEAFPAGDNLEHFFNVLTVIGEDLPPSKVTTIFSRSFTAKVYNTLFNRTNGLMVVRARGLSLEDAKKTPQPPAQSVVILGYPEGRSATDEEKIIVADLMGLTVDDIMQIRIVRNY